MGIAKQPSDLIEGFEQVLKEVGTTTSFLDKLDDHPEMDTDYLWRVVFSGILNEKSQEGKLFKENLGKEIKAAEDMIK